MRKDITTIIIGVLFLLAGIAVGGSMLGFFDFTLNFDGWWTVFLIVPALLAIVQGGFNVGNIILLSVGVILLLDAQRILPHSFSWKLIFPLVLLVVGFQLLFGNRTASRFRGSKDSGGGSDNGSGGGSGGSGRTGSSSGGEGGSGGRTGSTAGNTGNTERKGGFSSYKTASVLFGGQDIIYGPEDFTGATYTAVFGGCTVNLRNVTIVGDVIISVTALFGGVDLILPDNVQVISNIIPILGGSDLKYVSSRDPLAPKIIINGNVSFGAIDIR